ncbi:hypothetical protein SRIMM317S_05377 [Streptomyces rimosus subsp. rimosus]
MPRRATLRTRRPARLRDRPGLPPGGASAARCRKTNAASTPPTSPNRWPCQLTPLSLGSAPHRIEPYTTATSAPRAMSSGLWSMKPRISRYPKRPKTTPEAPAVLLPAGAVSQTPSPLVSAMSRATPTNRARPLRSAARKPRSSSGRVFAARWSKPKWMKAAGSTSASSLISRGRTPKVSSAFPEAASAISRTHSSATHPSISAAAGFARSSARVIIGGTFLSPFPLLQTAVTGPVVPPDRLDAVEPQDDNPSQPGVTRPGGRSARPGTGSADVAPPSLGGGCLGRVRHAVRGVRGARPARGGGSGGPGRQPGYRG